MDSLDDGGKMACGVNETALKTKGIIWPFPMRIKQTFFVIKYNETN